jgi:hypothetical protein
MATYYVGDATKAKAAFLTKMLKQKSIWLEGTLVKTKHKNFDLYEMVHPEYGAGDELVYNDTAKNKWYLASVYNSRKISTGNSQDSLQKLIDRKIFILDHQINTAEFKETPCIIFNVEAA